MVTLLFFLVFLLVMTIGYAGLHLLAFRYEDRLYGFIDWFEGWGRKL